MHKQFTLFILLSLSLYSCGFIGIAQSLRGGEQEQKTPLLVFSSSTPEELIAETELVDRLYPVSGPYQLLAVERAELKYMMAERLVEGYTDPEKQKRFAETTREALTLAEQDNLSIQDLFDQQMSELLTMIEHKIPDEALYRVRLMAGNSIVLSSQALESPAVLAAGLDVETLELSIQNMRRVRRLVIDELRKREKENG